MAKAVILDVLESTIGKYVLNLDTSSLNVAVWSGKIELNALQLNADAVNKELARKAMEAPNFAIPFRVVSGSFASVQVDVPWARITSRSVVFRAKGLNILVEPYDHLSGEFSSDFDAAEAAHKRQSNKDKKFKEKRAHDLEEAEQSRKRLNAVRDLANMDGYGNNSNDGEDDQKRKASGSFAGRLARRVIENLQLDIEQVHLSLRSTGCAAGIVLDSLNLVTTDEEGKRKFVDRVSDSKDVSKSFLYKALQINGFGIYCNNDTVKSRNAQVGMGFHSGRSYLISPFSFQAKLRQSDCVKCIGFPKYMLSSKLSSISITVTRPQIELINSVTTMILAQRNSCRPLFPEYRPIHPIQKGTGKLWWKYAVRCIGRLNRRRSWTEFYIAFQKRKRYLNLFQRSNYHKTCPWLKSLNKEEKAELNELEMDQTIGIDVIMLWRNLAIVQTDIERKKYNQEYINYVSGLEEHRSSPTSKLSKSKKVIDIELNDEDLEALKSVSLDFSSQAVVSSDSILCDIKFTLESLKVYLITFENSPLASLRMGTASLSMVANADGSFEADFSMLDLTIKDLVTLNSSFPSIMRSLDSSDGNGSSIGIDQAISIHAKTNHAGDCDLIVKMVAFEIVASPLLLKEFRRFITFTDRQSYSARNPILQQSINGTAELFYDADDEMRNSVANMSNYFLNTETTTTNSNTGRFSDKLTASLADAWRSKVKDKKKWIVELDIHAPIVILPQNCINSEAPMLVLNLGNFKLLYGKSEPSSSVRDWFQNLNSAYDIDHASLQMSQMSLMIGSVGTQTTRTSGILKNSAENSLDALIEPISFRLNVGIENDSKLEGFGRKCVFGVLPSISIQTSPTQINTMMSIIDTWSSFLKSEDIIIGGNDSSDSLIIAEEEPHHIERSSSIQNFALLNSMNQTQTLPGEKGECSHFSICLKKLNVTIFNNDGEFVEANLVSVVLSMSQRFDGVSSTRLRMGWFWILDNLQLNYPRQQRIVAHSNLPQSDTDHIDNNKIIKLLEKEGVFDDDHITSSELADITISKVASSEFDARKSPIFRMTGDNTNYIYAKFTSLYINWNPHVIKQLLAFKENFFNDSLPLSNQPHPGTPARNLLTAQIPKKSPLTDSLVMPKRQVAKSSPSYICIIAEMKSLVITLNSARDDLPLFLLTMTDSKLVFQMSDSDDKDMFVGFTLGDFRLETPAGGQTRKDYQTILGLAPNESSSLLQIEYGDRKCLDSIRVLNDFNRDSCEAYAKVILSPMRFVYLQAQALTLVEYFTEGVLGALTAQVASSAAAAAIELAQTDDGEKIFDIRATGFNFILPLSVHSPDFLALNSGNMIIRYKSFSNPGEGAADLQLENFTITCNQNRNLINSPVSILVGVSLAPHDGQTAEDRSMRVKISIDCAEFVLCKRHYEQIMNTLNYNIGEKDSYLRNESNVPGMGKEFDKTSVELQSPSRKSTESLTHGGVVYSEIEKRMYIDFRVKTVSLELVGDGINDSILCLTAVETHVSMKMITDENKTCFDVTMLNLECEDRRVQSLENDFRNIFSQSNSNDGTNELGKDVFKLSYSKLNDETKKDIIMKIGSPQIVVIPDIISQVLEFIDIPKPTDVNKLGEQTVDMIHRNSENVAEVGVENRTCDTTLNIETLDCRLVLIDIVGSDDYGSSLFYIRNNEPAEAFVLKGKCAINLSSTSEIATSKKHKMDVDINGQRIEMYTARGQLLDSPVQILEPAQISGFATWKLEGEKQVSEIRLVAMSTLDFSLSMQDLSLIMSILSSLSTSFSSENEDDNDTTRASKLDDAAVSQLEMLSSALDISDHQDDNSVHSSTSTKSNQPVANKSDKNVDLSTETETVTTIKLTIPSAEFTVINDLQGMDEALFKVLLSNFVSSAEMQKARIITSDVTIQNKLPATTLLFNFFFNTNILADYFNTSTKLWEHFLVQPWEITFKGDRRYKNRKTWRFATAFDIESYPCNISFSEQFLISFGAASKMWSMYTKTTEKALSIGLSNITNEEPSEKTQQLSSSIKNRAATAVRCLKTTMPYAIENDSGLTVFFELGSGCDEDASSMTKCAPGSTQFFNFKPPRAQGIGAKRLYGQDIGHLKAMSLFIRNHEIHFNHLDEEINRPKRVHELDNDCYVFTDVVRKGKTTILRLSSRVMIFNQTKLPFEVYLKDKHDVHKVGMCHAKRTKCSQSSSSLPGHSNKLPNGKTKIGIPVDMLKKSFQEYPLRKSTKTLSLLLQSPYSPDLLCGTIPIPPHNKLFQIAKRQRRSFTFETTFTNVIPDNYMKNPTRLVAQVHCSVNIVEHSYPFVEFFVCPRASLRNLLHVNLFMKTPMPHTISNTIDTTSGTYDNNEVTHVVEPFGEVEVFTPGVSVAFMFKCADTARGGLGTDWNDAGWIDIPIGKNRFINFPLRCVFPFAQKSNESYRSGGSEFFIIDSQSPWNGSNNKGLESFTSTKMDDKSRDRRQNDFSKSPPIENVRKVYITVKNIGVDHTGEALFEQATNLPTQDITTSDSSLFYYPFSIFCSSLRKRRLSLLPGSSVPIRLLRSSIDGIRPSAPFRPEDVALSDGGMESTPILWKDNSSSGYFIYRKLSVDNQFELHVIPEFVVYNGSGQLVVIKQHGGLEFPLTSEKIAQVYKGGQNDSIPLSFEFVNHEATTAYIEVNTLGLKVGVVRSLRTGFPIGSLAVQTIIGSKDSRFVIKIGKLKFGSNNMNKNKDGSPSLFADDFFRFRIRWSILDIILNDTQRLSDKNRTLSNEKGQKLLENDASNSAHDSSYMLTMESSNASEGTDSRVARIVFDRFTVDYQRIFKNDEKESVYSAKKFIVSPERSQLSVVIKNISMIDCSCDNKPVSVLKYSSNDTSFFDLCIRIRGSEDSGLVLVDLFDLNLAYSAGKSDKIIVNGTEEFLWYLLDIANRTAEATSEVAGSQTEFKWESDQDGYSLTVVEKLQETDTLDEDGTYCPPKSDTLYDIRLARISPVSFLVSFKRQPQASRYREVQNIQSAKMVNYFVTRLRFTIDKADLRFDGYVVKNTKGPADRLMEIIITVYKSRMKYKLIEILRATSLNDWKALSGRHDGMEEQIEGDMLRATGNLAGRSAGFVLKRVGQGIGGGVSSATSNLGNEIQKRSELMGAGAVGASVNSVLSGVGSGFGSTFQGLGSGSGKLLRGGVQGLGHAVGGVSGGVMLASRGKFSDGANMVGEGVGRGAETIVSGAAEGVYTVGKGLFSGVKNIGKGLTGGFTADKKEKEKNNKH